MESLWDAIDNYLIAAVQEDLGTASSYSTYRVADADVIVAEKLEHEKLTSPSVLISGWDMETQTGPHGEDGTVILVNKHMYTLGAVIKCDTWEAASSAAKVMAKRIQAMVASRFGFGGLASDDGERVYQTLLGKSGTQVVGKHEGKYTGIVAVELDVWSETT